MSRDEKIRLAFASLAREARPRDDCPAAGVLFDAATGSATSEQLEAMVEHTVVCPVCAESWRLARELCDATELAGGTAGPGSRRFLWFALAAAAVVLAVALPVVVPRLGRQAPPEWRSQERMEIRSLQPEKHQMPRDQFVLRWSEPAPGARYSLTVGNERLEPLVSQDDLDRAEFQVPAKALEPLPAGARVYWRVQARLPDGRRVDSPTFIALVP